MKKYKLNIFIIIIIICIVVSIIILNIFSKKVLPIFMEYAISEMKNISTITINNAVKNEINNFDNNMLYITKNKDNEIQMIDFDSNKVNKMLISITQSVLDNLNKMDINENNASFEKINLNEKLIYEIPLGVISNNIFLSNFGPKIPVKLNIIGDVVSNIKSDIKEYGINNALIQISISISITEKIIIPFMSDTINVKTDIPISLKIMQGNIPSYYGGFFSKNSGILSIPTE